MKEIKIYSDALDKELCEKFLVPHVGEFLRSHFVKWPKATRIYNGVVSQDTDVTPFDDSSVLALENYDNTIIVVAYPQSAGAIIAGSIILAVASVALTYALTPSGGAGSLIAKGNEQAPSPNGQLGNRENKARPGGQIPYILGTDLSKPDLLNLPFDFFENNQQFQLNWLGVGVGEFDINSSWVKEGETRVSEIEGATAEFYGPNTKPGDTPQYRVGSAITETLKVTEKVSGVNGQLLEAPNSQYYKSQAADLTPSSPNILTLGASSDVSLDDVYKVGDIVQLTLPGFTGNVIDGSLDYAAEVGNIHIGTSFRQIRFSSGSLAAPNLWVGAEFTTTGFPTTTSPGGQGQPDIVYSNDGLKVVTAITLDSAGEDIISYDNVDPHTISETTHYNKTIAIEVSPTSTRTPAFNGTYTVATVSDKVITFTSPESVQEGWSWLSYLTASPARSGTLVVNINKPIGPFFCDNASIEQFAINLIARNGLYAKSSSTSRQKKRSVAFNVELTPVDSAGTSTGPAVNTTVILDGSATTTGRIAGTLKITPSTGGYYSIRVWRTTDKDYDFSGTVVEDVQLRDIYYFSPHGKTTFGNLTTVFLKTAATEVATSQRGLLFNCEVSRKIPTRVSGSTFTTAKSVTSQVDELVSFLATDPHFGRRTIEEVDHDSIYGAVALARAAFGHSSATEFNGTFSKSNVVFADILATVLGAANCLEYRRGHQIKAIFKGKKTLSSMLLNHRNILPGSQTIDFKGGNKNGHDGVEYVYRDDKYQPATISLPAGTVLTNPKRVESRGIVGKFQAHFNANRAWNEIRFQNSFTSFTAVEEAGSLVRGERIQVADQTRPDTQDGDVESISGTTLTLSRSVSLESGASYSCFLLHPDKTVESIAVTGSPSNFTLTLTAEPSQALVVSGSKNTKTKFNLVKDTNANRDLFTVTSVKRAGAMTYKVTASNYSDAFFANDSDKINGVIGLDGEPV